MLQIKLLAFCMICSIIHQSAEFVIKAAVVTVSLFYLYEKDVKKELKRGAGNLRMCYTFSVQ